MKNLLLFGPLLWLRRILLFALVILVVLGLILFFAAHSPLAIKKVADTYAGDYNISYDAIKGNALTGVEIHHVQFKHKTLAKKVTLKWNPNTLVTKTITLNTLHIENANVDVIKDMIASLSTENNTRSVEDNTSHFGFAIDAKNIDITLMPLIQNNISISKARLRSDALVYKEDAFRVDNLDFALDTNITDISLRGSMKEQVVTLSHLDVNDTNLTALVALFTGKSNKMTKEDTEQTHTANIFIPKKVNIENLHTNILPFVYEPVKIKQIILDANDISFDVEHLVLEDARLDLNGTTNLSHVHYNGSAHNNHLLGTINFTPNNRLYKHYGLPLRKEAIAHVIVDFNASTEYVEADVKVKGKNILESKKGAFNVDINRFTSHVIYDINSSRLTADTQALVTTPYAKEIEITNLFTMNETMQYKGEVNAKKLIGFDEKLTNPLHNLKVIYSGDEKSIQAKLSSKAFKGTFDSKDFKTGDVHLETIKPLVVSEFVALPKEFKDTKVNLIADAPLDFKNLTAIYAKVKVASNVVNMHADVGYGKNIEVKGQIEIPKDSLLKAYSKEVKWEALSPINTNVKLSNASLVLKLTSKALHADIDYGRKLGNVKGKVNLGGLVTTLSGNVQQKLKIQTKITSMKTLGKNIASLYAVEELPPIEGKIDATLRIDKLKTAQFILSSPQLIYKVDRKTKHIIKDVKLVAGMDASKIVLKSYKGTFNKQKYFSTKTAMITLGDNIKVANFWLNDTLKVTGNYNTKNQKGNFVAEAKNFHIKDKVADIQTQIDLKIERDSNHTTVKGKIILLKGKITPDLQGNHSFASDSDIVIIQEMHKRKKSPFIDNLTLAVKIETKESLRLKQRSMNIRLKPDFTINKDKGGKLLYFGSIALLKGGTYVFQDKRFVLGKSFIYFTGDINKPVLDIKAKYKSINHLITVAITGTPAAPKIHFSSTPSLTREQILSVILFDTVAGGDTQSANDMMKMMGGAMAKAALADVGITVDHLVFGEGNSIEVGKKLSNKITVIYINGIVPKVKLKYQHSKRTESVIGVSKESQSYDIIYKRDF